MDTQTATVTAQPLHAFRFTGSGSEYFRIWIVNLLLTVLTLGIYSAWAKVRRLKYFYGNTDVAGARFDYHGSPIAILKGRLVALGLVILYSASTNIISIWSLVGLAFLALLLPWLLRNSFRFRLRNSSYRGLRFGFHGPLGGAYSTFLLYPILMFVSVYLLAPLFHARLKQYQHGNARYGQADFSFDAGVWDFFKAYFPVMVLAVLGLIGAFFAMGGVVALSGVDPEEKPQVALMAGLVFAGSVIVIMMLITPLWQSRVQNLTWNSTRLGAHRFNSTLKAWPLLGIQLSNFLLILLTLGLFTPWAMVRVARYRAESMALLPAGDLDDFVASQSRDVSAAGEEAAEMFDFDLGL